MVDPENLKKMSKDEIIECCSNIADWGFNDYEEWEQQSAVYGLLDLYKKQQKEIEELKEKNKTLETLLQGNLYEMYLYYKELASKYQANSISKDKIKELIKEIQETMCPMCCECGLCEEFEKILEEN